jgi:hypothetical protein
MDWFSSFFDKLSKVQIYSEEIIYDSAHEQALIFADYAWKIVFGFCHQ